MPAKKSAAKKPAAKKSAAKKAPEKKAAKKTAAKKAPEKKAAKKTAAKKAPAKKAPAKKAAKKAPATKSAAKKAPARKAAKKTAATKSAAKKAPARKAAATQAPAASTVRRTGGLVGSSPTPTGKKLTSSPYDEKFLDAQRAMLTEERAQYTRQADVLLAEAESLTADREPGDVQFDEESGEGDTLAVERERDLALSAQARAAVEEIDAALTRIENGVYGICRVSGLAIPKERLHAIPWATERVEYKVGGFGRR